MTEQPERQSGANDVAGPSIWVWNTGIFNSSVYNVACLSASTFHVRLNLLTAWGKDKIVRALEDGVPPETAISGKRVEISLESVRELRYSEEADVLEIHGGAKAPVVVCGRRASGIRETYKALREASSIQEVILRPSVVREMYEALRGRIAPGVAPTAGNLEARNAINAPVIGLFMTALFGGIAIWLSTRAAPDIHHLVLHPVVPHHNAPWAEFKDWLGAIPARIGTGNVVVIVVVVAACFAWWLAYRLSHPHRAEIIVPAGRIAGPA
jgi:hypothetical protein